MKERTFLQVDYEDMKKGLDPLGLLIVSKVKEHERNNEQCSLSNNDFSNMFNVKTKKTIISHIDKLVEDGILCRIYREMNGVKVRYLSIVGGVKNTLDGTKNEPHAELEEETSSINELPLEEKVQRMKEALQMNKDPNYDSTEELY